MFLSKKVKVKSKKGHEWKVFRSDCRFWDDCSVNMELKMRFPSLCTQSTIRNLYRKCFSFVNYNWFSRISFKATGKSYYLLAVSYFIYALWVVQYPSRNKLCKGVRQDKAMGNKVNRNEFHFERGKKEENRKESWGKESREEWKENGTDVSLFLERILLVSPPGGEAPRGNFQR